MDSKQKAAFVKSMQKRRPSFARGGMVRRNYDIGGNVLAGPQNLVNTTAANPNVGITGSIGNALGLNDQFQAGSALITPGTNTGQLNSSYAGVQDALNNQTQLTNSLTGQVPGAVNNQAAVAAQELAMTQGLGPNPAMAQLAQTTGNNIASQAALQAGQRGASGNVGLMARQIGQQGGAINQQAVGQGATQEAQQQIAAQNNLTGLANQQINQTGQAVGAQNTAQQGEQSTLQNANTAANNAAVNMQSNVNSTNAATAATNAAGNKGILGGVGSAVSGVLGGLGLAEGGMVEKDHHIALAEMNSASLAHAKQNFAKGGTAGGPVSNWLNGVSGNNTSSGTLNDQPAGGGMLPPVTPDYSNSLGTSVGKGIKSLFGSSPSATSSYDQYADSGFDPKQMDLEHSRQQAYDAGGLNPSGPGVSMDSSTPPIAMAGGPGVYAPVVGDPFAGVGPNYQEGQPNPDLTFNANGGMMGAPCEGPHHGHVANYLNGGKVPAMVSPGEIKLSPDQVQRVMKNGEDPAKVGEKFKGRAKVKGNSLKNDIIPVDLDEGSIIIDREDVGSKEKRAAFVRKTVAKKRAGKR